MKGHIQGYSAPVILNCLSCPHFRKEQNVVYSSAWLLQREEKICIKGTFSDSWVSRVVRPQLMDFSQHIKDYLVCTSQIMTVLLSSTDDLILKPWHERQQLTCISLMNARLLF